MNLQYLKKPFQRKLGYLKLNKKAKIEDCNDGPVTTIAVSESLAANKSDDAYNMTAFKGELDSVVSKYLTQVKEITSTEPQRDQLTKVQFKLCTEDLNRTENSFEDPQSELNFGDDYEDLQINIPPFVDPVLCTDCPGEHFEEPFYENCIESSYDEHIYENVENSSENEVTNHYDILSNVPKPSLPPKPDFLSQLAAQQSEPVKRIWNPFVNSAIEADEFPSTNPFTSSRIMETDEQTMIIDGLDTSDLGSSGEDTVSVEEWPLPPTPPAEDEKCILEDGPLPPPPPELALQQLEEVIRQEEDRRSTVHLQKEAIEQKYGIKAKTEEPDVEAVNTNVSSLLEDGMENTFIARPKLIELQEESSTDDDTPAIRHSLIIDLQDSCLVIPHTPNPSEVKGSENAKRDFYNWPDHNANINGDNEEEKKQQNIYQNVKNNYRECKDLHNLNNQPSNNLLPGKNEREFSSLPPKLNTLAITDQVSQDISEKTEDLSLDICLQKVYKSTNAITNTHPDTIAAPPSEFQTDDGSDGIYSAALISIHSGHSSLSNPSLTNISDGSLGVEEELNSKGVDIILKQAISSRESIESIHKNNKSCDSLHSSNSSSNTFGTQTELKKKLNNNPDKEHRIDKPKESVPKPGLLTFGVPSLNVEQKRLSVIKEITVKAKHKDTWIKTKDLQHNLNSEGKHSLIKKSQSFSFHTGNLIQNKNDLKNITSQDDLSAKNSHLEGISNSLDKKKELYPKNKVTNNKLISLPEKGKSFSGRSSRDFNNSNHSYNNGSLAALGINKHNFKTANLTALGLKKCENNSGDVQDNVTSKSNHLETKNCYLLQTQEDDNTEEIVNENIEKKVNINSMENCNLLLSETLPISAELGDNHSYIQKSIQFQWSENPSKSQTDQLYVVYDSKNELNNIHSDMNETNSKENQSELNEDNEEINTKELAFKSDFIEIGKLLTEEEDTQKKDCFSKSKNIDISHKINQRQREQFEDSICSKFSEGNTPEKDLPTETQQVHSQKVVSDYETETYSNTIGKKQNKQDHLSSSKQPILNTIGSSLKEESSQRLDQSQNIEEGHSNHSKYSEWTTLETVLSKESHESPLQNLESDSHDETCNQSINKIQNKQDQSSSSKFSEFTVFGISAVKEDSSQKINQRQSIQECTTFETVLSKESQKTPLQNVELDPNDETSDHLINKKLNKQDQSSASNFPESTTFELSSVKEDSSQRINQKQSIQGYSNHSKFSEWTTLETVLSKESHETPSQNVESDPDDETCNQTINKKLNKQDQTSSSKFSELTTFGISSVKEDSSQIINQRQSIQEDYISSSNVSARGENGTSSSKESHSPPSKRIVVYESILENRSSTAAYWERRMVDAMEDDSGWESVANVQFQQHPGVEDSPGNVSPDLDFLPAPPPQFDNSPSDDCENLEPTNNLVDDSSTQEPTFLIDPPPPMEVPPPQQEQGNLINTNITEHENKVPAKQYVYGINEQSTQSGSARIVETMIKKSASQENIIEAEIRAQQHKEEQLRLEGTLKGMRDHESSSTASHESDEGFVDRVAPEDASNQFTNSNNLITTNGYTHTIAGTDGEPVIYDAVPPPDYTIQGSLLGVSKSTETKIALEIRELKEREEELRMIRERLNESRQGFNEEDDTQSNSSRDQLLDDHLTSLTATTDEGNYSECGDPVLSEDKSSTGSNSGMSTPDIMSRGNLLDGSRRRTMTVMPFQEDTAEDEPVYHRIQKESVIEREIRSAREREEAFRAEKGLISTSTGNRSTSIRSTVSAPQDPVNDVRDVQHRMATSRIQQEIQETSVKERELRDAGTILTTSEETVDSKVTRLSDLAELNWDKDSPRRTPSQSYSGGRRGSSAFSPTSSPVPNFTPSPVVPGNHLRKSLSTTNLATTPVNTSNMRAPKGLMQKFIASRGKMTPSAFNSTPTNGNIPTNRGIATRPMRVEPKVAVIRREQSQRIEQERTEQQKTLYRRSYCTAGEKIQSELKEMQMREEELRRLRAASMAISQPNLAGLCLDDGPSESRMEIETNGLHSAISNPNLLEDESSQPQVIEKGVRRRSALIAQWENRIQQTIDT